MAPTWKRLHSKWWKFGHEPIFQSEVIKLQLLTYSELETDKKQSAEYSLKAKYSTNFDYTDDDSILGDITIE